VTANFSYDGTRLVTASADYTARLWDVRTGLPIGGTLNHKDKVTAARFSRDGKRVVTASWDFTAQVWDAITGNPTGEVFQMQRDMQPLYDAEFSPDDRRFVLATGNDAEILDIARHCPVMRFSTHGDLIGSAEFNTNGEFLVTASQNGIAQVWNAVTGKPAGLPLRHKSPVKRVTFSPSGRYVATACDNSVRIWDVASDVVWGLPLMHGAQVNSVTFSPNEQYIATACSDGTAQIWDLHCIRVVDKTDRKSRSQLASLLEAISETKIAPKTDTPICSPNDLHLLRNQLLHRPDTLWAYREVLAWYFSDPTIRPIWPGNHRTQPELVASLRNIDQIQTHQAAYELNPADPLVLLRIAGDEKDPIRRRFQKNYAIQKLPNNVEVYTNAIAILEQQKDQVLATNLRKEAVIKFPRLKELRNQQ
jgi:WD40 repeat protein